MPVSQMDINLIEMAIEELAIDAYIWKPVYINELYPKFAIETLILSRFDQKWPVWTTIDNVLYHIMDCWIREWISNNKTTAQEYIQVLSCAIKSLNCEEGMYIKLNMDLLSTSMSIQYKDRIIAPRNINTENKKLLKDALQKLNQYYTNVDKLYQKAKQIHDEYTIEQSLISWIGFITTKATLIAK